MLAVQTTQANLAEFSRCDDRPWLPVEEQNVNQDADQADESIAEQVDRALWNIGVLRTTDYREIDVDVKDGVVFLSGHVISASNQQRAEVAAAEKYSDFDPSCFTAPGKDLMPPYPYCLDEVLFPVESVEERKKGG
jgi:hypothetical protein